MSQIPAEQWIEAFRLFDTAIDMAEPERSVWLEQLKARLPDLSTAVQSLLSAHARRRTDDFLEKGAVVGEADGVEPWDESAPLQAGSQVGPYRLVRPLGQGGMAAVWLAMGGDDKLRREVALKMPLGFLWRPGLSARFARERDILARLEHPNIARLYDAGVCGSDSAVPGLPYLAMEYVDGKTLTLHADANALSLGARLAMMMEVLEAVQYAHTRLVIHRDLKPANILVTPEGHVRLLDFGVAKLLAGDDDDRTQVTQFAGQAFTPDYASPEQMCGEVLGVSSDVYSLGVVLYELLCGQRPYHLQRAPSGVLDRSTMETPPIPPSQRIDAARANCRGTTAARISQELAGDLDTIALKALKLRAEDRYSTVAELAGDLRRHMAGEPVLARPDSFSYRARKYILRHRVVAGATAAVAFALVAGLAASIWQYQRAAEEARAAQVERDRALRSAERGEALNQFMSDLLVDAAKAGQQVDVKDLLKKQAANVELEFADDPSVLADLLIMLGELHGSLDGPATLLPYFDRAKTLLGDHGDPKQYVDLLCNSVRAKVHVGQLTTASATQMIQSAIANPSTQPDDAANCLYQQAALESEQGRPDVAAQTAQRALDRLTARPHDRREMSIVMGLLAASLAQAGKPQEADRQFRGALSLMEALHRERSVSASVLRLNWAVTLIQAGVPGPALDLLNRNLDIASADFPNSPLPARLVYAKAGSEIELGRFLPALDGLHQAQALADAAHDDVVLLGTHCALATALVNLGQSDAAEREFSLAEAMHSPALQAGPQARNAVHLTRATLELNARRFDLAKLAASAVIAEKASSKAHRAQALTNRASAQLGLDKAADALTDADAALVLSRAMQGDLPASTRTGKALLVRAQALKILGRADEARQSAVQAVGQLTATVDPQHPSLLEAIRIQESLASH